jgi:hypothetical protein
MFGIRRREFIAFVTPRGFFLHRICNRRGMTSDGPRSRYRSGRSPTRVVFLVRIALVPAAAPCWVQARYHRPGGRDEGFSDGPFWRLD